jgi:hypothetical protein
MELCFFFIYVSNEEVGCEMLMENGTGLSLDGTTDIFC